MPQDMCVPCEEGIINIRVGAIILKEGRVLMVRNQQAPYLYSVGGRIKFGETAEEAVIREVREETGVRLPIDRLGFVHENYFIGDSPKHLGQIYSELSFYFYMKTPADFEPVCRSFTEAAQQEYLDWVSPDDPRTVFPAFFRTELDPDDKSVKHVVTDERRKAVPEPVPTEAAGSAFGKKILVLGCSGSGKSTFALKLQEKTGLPLTHLDNVWWKPDRTHIPRNEFDRRLEEIISADEWILDGDYSRTYEVRIKACDTVIFLDLSEEECLRGITERVGKARPDMPWTEQQLDPELVELVKHYQSKNRPALLELFRKYPEKRVIVFSSRQEADAWLAKLPPAASLAAPKQPENEV